MPTHSTLHYDVLIIGSGAAGLGLALSIADTKRVAILSKEDLTAGSSQYAQGGIAVVMDNLHDSIASHINDTLNAGAGICDQRAVEYIIKNAKSAFEWLVAHGVIFTHENGHYHLTKEGGHSHRRILHAADKTGAVIVKTLAEQVLAHPNIDCFTHHMAVDLLLHQQQCAGAIIFDDHQSSTFIIQAKDTVIATGGASHVYLHNSNPNRSTGDGIAMAWRAGASVANLEFNQFHPTCLFHENAECFLITEAIRGEGGLLLLPNGERFMLSYDTRAELAPRDIVGRAIHTELKKHQIDCVFLDISHRENEFIKNAFPTIYTQCLKLGIDITKSPIPVVPAAHYTCGGVMTNLQGQTNIPHLYTIGESAYTGLHGANRMASNSLLECLVTAMSSAKAIAADQSAAITLPKTQIFYTHERGKTTFSIQAMTNELRHLMWHKMGIVRNDAELLAAKQRLLMMMDEINTTFGTQKLSTELIELRNMATVSLLMVDCAILRQESRGLHYNTDHPQTDLTGKITILKNATSTVSP